MASETLESLLNKATSPLDEDSESYIDGFCDKVKSDVDGAVTSSRLLAHKIQSPQELEAVKALKCLESCVKFCGEPFEKELGKYRFLNELIKVVSPKYLGKQSSVKVQQKIITMLYTWSCHFAAQNKIRDAYQMLKKQGIVKEDPKFDHSLIMHVPPPRDESNSIFQDNEKRQQLEKLLKSQKPEDLQAANRLIKSVVQAEEQKMEKMRKRNEILEETRNNVKLLNEMLECLQASGGGTSDNMAIMTELYGSCQKLRPTLFRLASDTDDSEKALMDILRANDDVSRVMQMYENVVNNKQGGTNTSEAEEEDSATNKLSNDLELLSLSTNTPAHHLIDDGLLMASNNDLTVPSTSNQFNFFSGLSGPAPAATNSDQDDQFLLNFQKSSSSSPPPPLSSNLVPSSNDIMSLDDVILQPNNLMAPTLASPVSEYKSPLSELDQLGSGLIEMTLGRKPIGGQFPSTSVNTKQPTLNELQQSHDLASSVKIEQQQQQNTSKIISGEMQGNLIQLPVNRPASGLASLLLNIDETPPSASAAPLSVATPPPHALNNDLNDVLVALDSIRPSSYPPLTIYDTDGVRVMVHFAKDNASPTRTDTLVSVVSIFSTKSVPLFDVTLQVAAPKVMKVKLQTPSSTQLSAFNPMIATAPITQIMIIANSSPKEVKLRYKLEYKTAASDEDLTAAAIAGEEHMAASYSGVITGFPATDSWGNI